jgi:hypothetical protein
MKIVLVGCGFVGSVFATEFMKRCYAGKLDPEFCFIDDDRVEARNCANQNFVLADIGRAKAEVLAQQAHDSDRIADWQQTRLAPDNIDALLEGADLIIDGVDNLATRQLLWGWGLRNEVPVLHLGISEQGTGKVEWTHKDHQTFSLRPDQTFGKELLDPPSGVTPPCELARMRGVGLNVGFAAACALGIYMGFDPESHLEGIATAGYFTDWHATPTGFVPQRETWGAQHHDQAA